LDYYGHFVLQFATLNKDNTPEIKHKFVTMKETVPGLIPLKWKEKKLVTIDDVFSESMKKDFDTSTIEANLFSRLKFYN